MSLQILFPWQDKDSFIGSDRLLILPGHGAAAASPSTRPPCRTRRRLWTTSTRHAFRHLFKYTIRKFFKHFIIIKLCNMSYTVKPVYNDYPWNPKIVAVVERWSLFRGSFLLSKLKMWPQNGGRYRQVVAIWRWSLAQVRLCHCRKPSSRDNNTRNVLW